MDQEMRSMTDVPVRVLGLPLVPWTFAQVVQRIDRLVQEGRPSYVITANLNYAMWTDRLPELRAINEGAAFIVADGMPLVWLSRLGRRALPERVTGADLIYGLCDLAVRQGYRMYFYGAAPGVAERAAARLQERYRGLQVVGVESPPFRPLTPAEEAELAGRVRAVRPHMFVAALGQPRGEITMARYTPLLGVPVCIQVGATLDFVAGRARRSPRWLQRLGLEWLYRLQREPRRLGQRYLDNLRFLGAALLSSRFRQERLGRPACRLGGP